MTYQRKDAHYRRAKAAGFRARSAYKLAELDERHRLLRKGDHVLDLGAWPGGWCQVALERVGPSGRVVGVDVVRVEPLPAKNLELLVGDVRDPGLAAKVIARLGGLADVVLSDVAPKLTGVRDVDEAHCAELISAVIELLPRVLKPDGRAVVKVFMDAGYRDHRARLEACFGEVKTARAEAARRGSAELYLIGRRFRPSVPACG